MKANINTNLFSAVVAFLIGVIVCYHTTQWAYFKIDTEINVSEFLISVLSLVLGIYIVVVIQKRQNYSQNHYNYLLQRLDSNWAEYNAFFDGISQRTSVAMKELNPFLKQFRMRNADLNRLIHPVAISNKLDETIDQFESAILKCPTANNVINYTVEKPAVEKLGKEVSEEFVRVYKEINRNC